MAKIDLDSLNVEELASLRDRALDRSRTRPDGGRMLGLADDAGALT